MGTRMKEITPEGAGSDAVLERWLTGSHPSMRKLRDDVRLHARGILSVLIEGEPGTGKERVARALHELSGRIEEPFIAINLAAISAGLLESELFGHEKGAFTGATERRIGHFERAASGMVFLDEIGDAPAQSQIRMLRAMDPGEFTRVGGSETLAMKARIVAATNANPEASLRADFFDRVAGIRLHVPPLRERLSDLPMLSLALLQEHATRTGSTAQGVSDAGLALLAGHSWPDNVRGLKRVVWQCASWVRGTLI
jgi:DNA-binding NtrC family response regulator